MKKFSDSVCQAMSRRLATFRSMSRPSTLTRIMSPMLDVPALGEAGVERHQRRPVVVRPATTCRRRCGAGRRRRRHRSGRGRRAAPRRVSGVALHLVGRHAVHRDDAGAQRSAPAARPAPPAGRGRFARTGQAGRSGCRRRRSWGRWRATAPAPRGGYCPGSARPRPGSTAPARPTAAAAPWRCRGGTGWRCPAGPRAADRRGASRARRITTKPPSAEQHQGRPAPRRRNTARSAGRSAVATVRPIRASDQRGVDRDQALAPAGCAPAAARRGTARRRGCAPRARAATARKPARSAAHRPRPAAAAPDRCPAPAAPAGGRFRNTMAPAEAGQCPATQADDDADDSQRQHLDQAHRKHQCGRRRPGSAGSRWCAPARPARRAHRWRRRCRRPAARSGRPGSGTGWSGR